MNQFFHAAKPMFDLFENDMKCLNENQGADWYKKCNSGYEIADHMNNVNGNLIKLWQSIPEQFKIK